MPADPRYGEEFYEVVRTSACRSAEVVVPLLLELMRPSSVVDVGCGHGTWLSVFSEHGVGDIWGIDGSDVDRTRLEIPEDRFSARDLSKPFDADRQFDLAVSLEVAEHLPPESAEHFVASLAAFSPKVLFSAAIPGQGGAHHVNEQWAEYWAGLFGRHGYVPVDCLRRKVWDDDRVDWWYAQNMLVYVRHKELAGEPRLAGEHQWAGTRQLSVVHPKKFELLREWAAEHYAG